MPEPTQHRVKLVPEMEGLTARWYARQRGSAPQLAAYRTSAAELTADLADGAHVLEVAPGPGYHAVEVARDGRFRVTGLDVSHTMVRLATEYARREGVAVDFRQGDAADLPFADTSFDLVVCQAALKNFTHPVRALDEMHRVLRPGGAAVIVDMRREATAADIAAEVAAMQLSRPNAALTRLALTGLRRRAHSEGDLGRLAATSRFGGADIRGHGLGVQVQLKRT